MERKKLKYLDNNKYIIVLENGDEYVIPVRNVEMVAKYVDLVFSLDQSNNKDAEFNGFKNIITGKASISGFGVEVLGLKKGMFNEVDIIVRPRSLKKEILKTSVSMEAKDLYKYDVVFSCLLKDKDVGILEDELSCEIFLDDKGFSELCCFIKTRRLAHLVFLIKAKENLYVSPVEDSFASNEIITWYLKPDNGGDGVKSASGDLTLISFSMRRLPLFNKLGEVDENNDEADNVLSHENATATDEMNKSVDAKAQELMHKVNIKLATMRTSNVFLWLMVVVMAIFQIFK